MLGAGEGLANTGGDPAPTQQGRPLRTLYVAKSAGSLPQTRFVRTRDCVRRARLCVNSVGGLELVYLIKGTMPRRTRTALDAHPLAFEVDAFPPMVTCAIS